MEEYEDIKVGQVWSQDNNPHVKYKIHSMTPNFAYLKRDGAIAYIRCSKAHLLKHCTLVANEDQPTMSKVSPKCSHNWKKDMFFSAMVYYTCSKCGTKQENT